MSAGNLDARPSVVASVVIPVRNSAGRLRECLAALCRQTLPDPFEVVVVDDGSTEDLEPVHAEFKSQLAALTWQRHAVNRGPATARNTGIERARGEIVVFTDADCVPDRTWLAAMLAPFHQPEVVGVKGCYRTRQTDMAARCAQVEFMERYRNLQAAPNIDFVDTYSGAYRRAALQAVGGFDTSFPVPDNEDVDLAWRVLEHGGRFAFASDAIVFHRHREGFLPYFRLKFGRGFWRMKVIGRHPQRAGGGVYTPFSLKLQLALTPLLFLGAVLLPLLDSKWRARWSGLAGMLAAVWAGSCVPLWREAWVTDRATIPVIPVFCLLRAVALIAGIVAGTARFAREWSNHRWSGNVLVDNQLRK